MPQSDAERLAAAAQRARTRSSTPRRGATRAQVEAAKSRITLPSQRRAQAATSSGGGGQSIIEQAVDTALDVGKGVVTGLAPAVWDSTVGNVGSAVQNIALRQDSGEIRDRSGPLGSLGRLFANESMLESIEQGESLGAQFRKAAPIIAEPAVSLYEGGGRVKELAEVALTDRGIEDTQYGRANRDSQIVPLLFEDVGNVLLGVMGAGGAAGAAKGAAAGARAGTGAVRGARAGARASLTGTGPASRARKIDDAIGKAILSPLRSPTIASRLATGEGMNPVRRYQTGENLRPALANTRAGRALANSGLGNWTKTRLIGSNPDVVAVRDEMDLGNKINAVRRGEEALGPAQQVYDVLTGRERGLKRKELRTPEQVEHMNAAAVLDMIEGDAVLPVALIDDLRKTDAEAYGAFVEEMRSAFADELTVGAMDTFVDYKMGRLDADLADDIRSAQDIWRSQALYSDDVRPVLGADVPIGAQQNFLKGTGRVAEEKAGGRGWRERSLEQEVLPDNLTPIERRAARKLRSADREITRRREDVDRLSARRRTTDEALADPVGFSEEVFGRATAEARRIVATAPDVVADVQARFARPLTQDGLIRAVRNDLLDRRRQIDGLDSVPNAPLFQTAATLDRPLFLPRQNATSGLVREAGKDAVSRRARRSERNNTGRADQNAARAEQIRANRAPVTVSKRVLNGVAATARAQARAQNRSKRATAALRQAEAKLQRVLPEDRAAIRSQIRAYRREIRSQLEADRDAVVSALTDDLLARTGGDSVVLRSIDEVGVVEAALREAGLTSDWRKLQYPGTTKRIFRADLTPMGQGRIAGAVEADRLGVDVATLASEVIVPLQEARSLSFAGVVDDGIDVAHSWLAATEAEANMLVGPVDEAVDAWAQAEGNPAAAAREDAMWDEAVERMQQVYALRAAGDEIRSAFDGASPGARRAMLSMLAEEAATTADENLAGRIDTASSTLGEQGARVGRAQGLAEGRAQGRADEASAAAARDAKVTGSRVLPEMEGQAAARAGGSAVRQMAPELRLVGEQQRALRDLSRAERAKATLERHVQQQLDAAAEMLTSAPARSRPAVELGRTAQRVLSEMDWSAYNVPASLATRLQAEVLTTVADVLVKTDPDHMRGGSAALLTQQAGVSASKTGGAKRVQAARTKGTGRVPLDLTKQAALALRDIRQQTTNETMFRVAEQIGQSPSKVKAEYAAKHGIDPKDLDGMPMLAMASDLHGGEWVGWNPMSLFPEVFEGTTGRRPKFIDETGADAMVLAPRWVPEAFEYASSQDSAIAQALIDRPTRVFKGAVLALSPRWMVGNVVSGAIMLHAADVTVADIGRHFRQSFSELRKMGKGQRSTILPREMLDTGLTANEMSTLQNLEVSALDNIDADERALTGKKGGKVRQAGAKVVATGYGLNTFVDNWYKSIAAMTKAEKAGWDRSSGTMVPTQAVKEALAIMGDYDKMTTFERRVLRRAFPFYAWVRHITKLTHKVATDDPARMLWNIHLANVFAPEDELWEQVPWLRGAVQAGDEYLNIGWLFPFDTTAQMDLSNPASIVGGNLNPIIGTAVALTTGIDASFGEFEPLSRPGVRFGGSAEKAPLFSDPLGSAYLVGRNLPQFRGAWNEAQRRLNDGEALRQYDTGQVRPEEIDANRTGTNNAATILNIPLPRKYDVEGSLNRGRR